MVGGRNSRLEVAFEPRVEAVVVFFLEGSALLVETVSHGGVG